MFNLHKGVHWEQTAQIAQLVERPLLEQEGVGLNPGRTIPKL